jgi:hypothetical protein
LVRSTGRLDAMRRAKSESMLEKMEETSKNGREETGQKDCLVSLCMQAS